VVADAGSVNFDLDGPDRDGRLLVDALVLQPQVLDIGDFDLEAMMIRLAFLVGQDRCQTGGHRQRAGVVGCFQKTGHGWF
jgi:hypothetical protein